MGTHLLTLFSAFLPFQPWGPRELQSGSIYCRTDRLTLVHPMTSGESLGKAHKAHEPPAIIGVLASTAPHGCLSLVHTAAVYPGTVVPAPLLEMTFPLLF